MQSFARWISIVLVAVAGGCGGGEGTTGTAGTGGTTTGSQGGGGSSGTSTATTGGGGEGGTAGTGGTGGSSACAPADVLGLLQTYLDELHVSADLLATHPGPNEAVSFFHAPGLPEPPGNAASFYSLFMTCMGPTLFDPYCDQGLCSQLECTSNDASWANHMSLEAPPKTFGEFTYQKATIDLAWADGAEGITFDTAIESTGAMGADWTLNGSGAMDTMGVTLDADLPGLFAGGPAILTYAGGQSSQSASIVIGEVLIAQMNASGQLVATGFCP